MKLQIADRVSHARQSDIRRFSAICAAVGGINLSQGVCDQPAPPEVKQAARQAIGEDEASYTNLKGIAELRSAIAKKMLRFNGVECDPEREIVVTVGSAGAFGCAVMATLNPGDEAIVFSPFYSYHVHMLELVGVKVKYVDLAAPDWTFDPGLLEAAFTDKTRMIVVNTPANPTGKVFSRDELKLIVDLAARNNTWIATDEIYEYITYEKPHVSPAGLPGAREHTITISGASKTYAVTGWRVGYAVAPAELAEKMAVVNDLLYICAPAPLQHGIAAGLALPDSYYDDMRTDFLEKRELLATTLRDIGLTPYVPEGSYYMLAAFEPGRWENATAATESILEQTGVAVVPGSAFYRRPEDGARQLRFCYAKSRHDLEEACRRLRQLDTA